MLRLKHILTCAMVLIGLAVSCNASADNTAGAGASAFEETFTQLLKDHTHPAQANGISYIGVDYSAWGRDSNHAQAMKQIMIVKSLASANPEQRMAFWINAHNLLTIDLIVKHSETKSIKNLGNILQSPWKKYHWNIAGQDVTLDKIEHEILRPMGDPRIHMAINCASISCPDLRQEAFAAERLDAQLNEQVRSALANTSKILRYEAGTNTLYLSSIFKWFSADFKPDVVTWLGTRLKNLPSNPSVHYMSYDWGLNKVNKE